MLTMKRFSRGDTLVEVLFAVTVFSFVAVGALSIMNQGTAASQRSLETTLVRQQIDAQAEALRFMHSSYVAAYGPGVTFSPTDTTPAGQWARLTRASDPLVKTEASPFINPDTCPTRPDRSFIVDTANVRILSAAQNIQPATTFAQLDRSSSPVVGRGLWVEAVRSPTTADGRAGFIDFHIRGCWQAPGLSVPLTLGTIVRLYEPR